MICALNFYQVLLGVGDVVQAGLVARCGGELGSLYRVWSGRDSGVTGGCL